MMREIRFFALACAGCAATPDLHFDTSDASDEAAFESVDAFDAQSNEREEAATDAAVGSPSPEASSETEGGVGSGGGNVGGGSESPDAAIAIDAGHAACPGSPQCCGSIPCVGKKCPLRCSECATCPKGTICCAPDGKGVPISCVTGANACSSK